jgi:hypothetical protein
MMSLFSRQVKDYHHYSGRITQIALILIKLDQYQGSTIDGCCFWKGARVWEASLPVAQVYHSWGRGKKSRYSKPITPIEDRLYRGRGPTNDGQRV